MSFIAGLIDSKIRRILSVLAQNPKEHFHIQKLSARSKVPLSSTFRIVNKLVRMNAIEMLTIGKFKIYRLKENDNTKEIISLVGGKK
jgi:DNA-binding IclR family transcriptional regulator